MPRIRNITVDQPELPVSARRIQGRTTEPLVSRNDEFGSAVAISDGRCIVGVRREDRLIYFNSGQAHIYDARSGRLLHILDNPTAYGTGGGDEFGSSVDISGDRCIVGAFSADDASGLNSGKAYIFSVATGELLHTLDNPNDFGTGTNDTFGRSVAIDGDRCIVGANGEDDPTELTVGKAYIFDVTTGALLHTLDNPEPYGTGEGDNFGSSVDISGDRCIVGAVLANDATGIDTGKAYIFSVATGALLHTLDNPTAYGTSLDDQFGSSVAISGDRCIVGASREDDATRLSVGKAYIFSVTDGLLLYTLDNPDPAGNIRFGSSVSVSTTRYAVSAFSEVLANKVYVYERRSRLRIVGIELRGDFSTPSVEYLELRLPGTTTWYRYTSTADDAVYRPAKSSGNDDGTWQGPAEVMSGHFLDIESQVSFGVNVSPGGMPSGFHWQARLTVEVENILGSPGTSTSTVEFGGTGNGNNTVRRDFSLVITPNKIDTVTRDNTDSYFGISIDLSNDQLIIGASQERSLNNVVDSPEGLERADGAVYIFGQPQITYEMTAASSVDEGSALTVTVDTRNASLGNELYLQFYTSSYLILLSHTLDNPNAYGTSANDVFGRSVGIDGDRCIVGASGEDDAGGTSSGKTYIFSVDTGILLHTLHNPTAYGNSISDVFGTSVAISGDRCIVGARLEDDGGINGQSSGKAYIFDVTTGALLHTLDNPNAYGTSLDDNFGISVAISGDRCIVGADGEDDAGGSGSGKAYIFDVTTGALLHTLDNPNVFSTSFGDDFGSAVAISGDRCIVGALGEDESGRSAPGKAYIFSVATGDLLHILNNPNAYGTSTNDQFGTSVAIDGNRCIVGAPLEDDASGTSSGKAYIFDVTTGALLHTLDNPTAYGTGASDEFGSAVAISGDRCIVSADREDDASGTSSGKAYIFSVDAGILLHTLDNPNAYGTSLDDNFGISVAISGDRCIVGANGEDDAFNSLSGKAYIYDMSEIQSVASDLVENLEKFTITGDTTTFTITPEEDARTEGPRRLDIELRTYPTQLIPVNRLTSIINDTSISGVDIFGPDSINEGVSTAYTITGVDPDSLGDGTVLYYSLSKNEFTSNFGTVIVSNNTAEIILTATEDFTTEGNETAVLSIRLTNISGKLLGQKSITINDTSVETYDISPAADNVDEGSSLEFTMTTQGVPDSTLYWTIETNAGDFEVSSGTVVINSNSGTFSVTPIADFTTEGPETFTVSVRTGGTTGPIKVTSDPITINDISQTPTYEISPAANNVNENSSLVFSVTTTDVPDTTTLYWTIETNAGDFEVSSGTVVINSNSGTFSVTPIADFTTEGPETFTVNLRLDNIEGTVVATSGSITINDTSVETYDISPAADNVDEGSSLGFTVTTQGVPDTTTLYWTIETSAGDFEVSSGTVVINSNSGTFSVTPTRDGSQEGPETFTVSVRTGGTTGPIKVTSDPITINDTSTANIFSISTTYPYVVEGDDLTVNVSVDGLVNGVDYYWTIEGDSSQFNPVSGSFTINDNQGSFVVSPVLDEIWEFYQTFNIAVRKDSIIGDIVVLSNAITILNKNTPTRFIPDPNPLSDTAFGESLDVDGNVMIVSTQWLRNTADSEVYLIDITTGNLLFTLSNPDPINASVFTPDKFGFRVAISGNICAVSSPTQDQAVGDDSQTGKVYIFSVLDGSLTRTIENPNAYGTIDDDQFGTSLDLDGNILVVGAILEDDAGGTSSGKVYIFNVTTGALLHTLNNPNDYGTSANDKFGQDVSISGNLVLVGAPSEQSTTGHPNNNGIVYLFNTSTGQLVTQRRNPDTKSFEGGLSDSFGSSVLLLNDKYFVSSPYEFFQYTDEGCAYAFDLTTGNELYKLRIPVELPPQNTNFNDRFYSSFFGWKIVSNSSYVAVSDPQMGAFDIAGRSVGNGKVYLYDISTGNIISVIDNPGSSSRFGVGMYMDDTNLIISSDAGVYIYDAP